MSSQYSELWLKLVNDASFEGMLHAALRHAAYKLSDMAQRPLQLQTLQLKTRTISEIMLIDNDPEAETVGIYLRLSNDLPGVAILMLSLNDAMYLVDWLLETRPGTTTHLGDLERSALAETGNLVVSAFLNALAEFCGKALAPSPPAVRVDMLATILEAAVVSLADLSDSVLIIETNFVNLDSELALRLWILPRVPTQVNHRLTKLDTNEVQG